MPNPYLPKSKRYTKSQSLRAIQSCKGKILRVYQNNSDLKVADWVAIERLLDAWARKIGRTRTR